MAAELLGKTAKPGSDEIAIAEIAKPLLGKEMTMRYSERIDASGSAPEAAAGDTSTYSIQSHELQLKIVGITDLDPLRYTLLFERFLNPERVSMPDIDIDFCTKGRGRVIQYVTGQLSYGLPATSEVLRTGFEELAALAKTTTAIAGARVDSCLHLRLYCNEDRPCRTHGPRDPRHWRPMA